MYFHPSKESGFMTSFMLESLPTNLGQISIFAKLFFLSSSTYVELELVNIYISLHSLQYYSYNRGFKLNNYTLNSW